MDELQEQSKDLVQLARLALTGRTQDIQTYIHRMARKYQKLAPDLGIRLKELAQQAATRQSPLRSETVAVIPVDRDSRLQLLCIAPPNPLEREPIWSEDIRRQLDQIVSEHLHAAELMTQGLSPTRTAIFTGPPGVGKTLAARWLANKLTRPLLRLDLSAVISSFLGRTGNNVRHVLDYAKGVACVLLLDELDAIAKRRDDSHEVGELKRLVTVLLQELDDWPEGGVLVAASNHHALLDPAVWRRFEMQIEFTLPAPAAVRQAIRLFLGKESNITSLWETALAELLNGSSFSDIERELKNIRRLAVVNRCSLETLFPRLVQPHIERQSKAAKKHIALKLSAAGLSQRTVSELTGLSRDTLRKVTSGNMSSTNPRS